mgnify:CR=1 FL=1
MKEFKGTKGKWEFDDINMKIKGTGDIEGRTVIANVSPEMDYSRGMTTQCANACLISASPELLKALQELVEINEQRLEGAASWSLAKLWFRKTWDATERANKAINKALGL